MKTKSNITTLDQILDKKYGKKGQPKREQWEQQFEAIHEIDAMIATHLHTSY